MIPGTYNFTMYRGDYYYGPVIPLFSLAPWGGPANPVADGTITAQIRRQNNASVILGVFDIEVVDEDDMQIRLTMDKADTMIEGSAAEWDLQIEAAGNAWTPLRGTITIEGQITEVEA